MSAAVAIGSLVRARGGGRILSVPCPQQLNDIPAIVARKDSATRSADVIVDNLDGLREQAADEPLVMGGRRDEMWFTHAGVIARHFVSVTAAGG